ncbi:MAG: DUF4136 domain-containing protein [Deltaproteobacteria bacterium]|nr:DUF4136 domain-containing protein [Deltaproteobacteria bacterium]
MTRFARLISIEAAENHDFSSYRTWAWLPRASPDATGDPALAPRTEELLARGLVERGYVQVDASELPDFFVTFHVSVNASQQLRTQAHARETLDSTWGRGGQSYNLDRPSTIEHVAYEDVHLTVGIRDALAREIVWSAEHRREVRGEFAPHLEETLAELLEQVPPRRLTGS